jgi:hypothetical protein
MARSRGNPRSTSCTLADIDSGSSSYDRAAVDTVGEQLRAFLADS